MRLLLAAAALAVATPALADETTGEILAFDRKAGIIVMTDKTVWSLELGGTAADDLVAGDKIHVVYDTAGEDGMTAITEIHRVSDL